MKQTLLINTLKYRKKKNNDSVYYFSKKKGSIYPDKLPLLQKTPYMYNCKTCSERDKSDKKSQEFILIHINV